MDEKTQRQIIHLRGEVEEYRRLLQKAQNSPYAAGEDERQRYRDLIRGAEEEIARLQAAAKGSSGS